jgi:23S rRNA (uracil1939-C5)-methyltransferase
MDNNMVSKNDILEVLITAVASTGEGIAKIDGYAVFVPFAAFGDVVKIKVVKAGKSYGYGEITEIIKPSGGRVTPVCDVYEKCGGCNIMHLSYDRQLEFKKQRVVDALERIGGFKNPEVADTEGMDTPVNYRNKIQIPVSESGGRVTAGFYAPRSHRVIPAQGCILQHKENEKYLNAVLSWMDKHHISAYNEDSHKGIVRHIYTRIGFYSGEVMVSVVANAKTLPYGDELCEILKSITIAGLTLKSVVHNINTEKTNVILGGKNRVLFGGDFIQDSLDHLKFKISHNSFYQVNPVMTERLYRKAVGLLGNIKDKRVFDIYCGIGTISLFLAGNAGEVIGVEYAADAVADARENAEINNITNVKFYKGDANEVIPKLYAKGISADAAVVDPPRKGLGEELLNTLIKMSPQKIVYVSCNPATLARDLKFLHGHGYKIETVLPFDQFPNTAHVETVVLLSQLKPDDKIEIDLTLDELDITSAESKATYEEIKDYVQKNFALKVSSLYISQVKRKLGLEVGKNYNLPKSDNPAVPECPPEKEKAIIEALQHFGMI